MVVVALAVMVVVMLVVLDLQLVLVLEVLQMKFLDLHVAVDDDLAHVVKRCAVVEVRDVVSVHLNLNDTVTW